MKQAEEAAKAAPKKSAAAEPASPEGAAAKPEDAAGEETKPLVLKEALGGLPDDLKLLKGVGPKLEEKLNSLGFFHFEQIADWTEAEVAWVDARLKFKGRITRDGWIEQAKRLQVGDETEFAKRAKAEGIYKDDE